MWSYQLPGWSHQLPRWSSQLARWSYQPPTWSPTSFQLPPTFWFLTLRFVTLWFLTLWFNNLYKCFQLCIFFDFFDHVGGTHNLFSEILPSFGIKVTLVRHSERDSNFQPCGLDFVVLNFGFSTLWSPNLWSPTLWSPTLRSPTLWFPTLWSPTFASVISKFVILTLWSQLCDFWVSLCDFDCFFWSFAHSYIIRFILLKFQTSNLQLLHKQNLSMRKPLVTLL